MFTSLFLCIFFFMVNINAQSTTLKPQSSLVCYGSDNRTASGGFTNSTIFISGPYLLPVPTAQPRILNTATNPWAKAYVNQSCCTNYYSEALESGLKFLYQNWSYDYCGTMSTRCKQFLYWEEVFYNCDPFARQYVNPKDPYGGFVGLPLCSGFCNDWYDACKFDSTCAFDWSTNFPFDTNGDYGCASTSTYPNADRIHAQNAPAVCQTFGSMYANGADMCNSMWNATFTYSTDTTKCLSPYFYTAINPNAPATGFGGTNTNSPSQAATTGLSNSDKLGLGLGLGIGLPVLIALVGFGSFLLGKRYSTGAKATTDVSQWGERTSSFRGASIELSSSVGTAAVPAPAAATAPSATA